MTDYETIDGRIYLKLPLKLEKDEIYITIKYVKFCIDILCFAADRAIMWLNFLPTNSRPHFSPHVTNDCIILNSGHDSFHHGNYLLRIEELKKEHVYRKYDSIQMYVSIAKMAFFVRALMELGEIIMSNRDKFMEQVIYVRLPETVDNKLSKHYLPLNGDYSVANVQAKLDNFSKMYKVSRRMLKMVLEKGIMTRANHDEIQDYLVEKVNCIIYSVLIRLLTDAITKGTQVSMELLLQEITKQHQKERELGI